MSSSKQSRKHRKLAASPTTTSSSQAIPSSFTTAGNIASATSASASLTGTDSHVHPSTYDMYAVGEMDIEPSDSRYTPVPVVSRVYDSTTMTRCPHCKQTRNWEVTRDHIPNCPKKPLLLQQLGSTMPPAGQSMSSPNTYEDTTRYRDVGAYVSGNRYLSSRLPSHVGEPGSVHHQSVPDHQLPGGQGLLSQNSAGISTWNGWYGGSPVASGSYIPPASVPQVHQPVGLPYTRQIQGVPYAQQLAGARQAQPIPDVPYAQQPGAPYAPGYPYNPQPGVPYTQQPSGGSSFMYPYMPMNQPTDPSQEEAYRRRGRRPDRQW